MCFVRKALDWVFTRHELKWLDDIIPESHKREKEDKKKMAELSGEEVSLVSDLYMRIFIIYMHVTQHLPI